MYKLKPSEVILEDNYPIYAGYVYIVDNKFTRSEITGTVRTWKEWSGAQEIRRCELFEHDGAKIGDMVYSEFYKI